MILDGNPLEDLKASTRTVNVMVNGRLFDAATMAEIGGRATPAPTFYWQRLDGGLMRGAEWGPTAPATARRATAPRCPGSTAAPGPAA